MHRPAREDIEEFYHSNNIGDRFRISLEDCVELCKSPFARFKESMNKGEGKNAKFLWFGTFFVNPKAVRYWEVNAKKLYDKGVITEETLYIHENFCKNARINESLDNYIDFNKNKIEDEEEME